LSKFKQSGLPNKKTAKTLAMADREEELETFDNLDDLFTRCKQFGHNNLKCRTKSPKPLEEES